MFEWLFGRRSGDTADGNPTPGGNAGSLLSPEEMERIGTEDDPLLDYEAALERNFTATAAERRGDVDEAVALYETNVAGRFVGSFPYERLASVCEARNSPQEAVRVLATFVQLAQSGPFLAEPSARRTASCRR